MRRNVQVQFHQNMESTAVLIIDNILSSHVSTELHKKAGSVTTGSNRPSLEVLRIRKFFNPHNGAVYVRTLLLTLVICSLLCAPDIAELLLFSFLLRLATEHHMSVQTATALSLTLMWTGSWTCHKASSGKTHL